MKIKLIKIFEMIRTSYWFWPILMTLGSLIFALAIIQLDQSKKVKFPEILSGLFSGGSEGARTVLSLLASSMITVAGVVFSITIVALTLASQQFGPRLLRNFMKDLGNQIVLGTFISTFVYCLTILPTIHETDQSTFIPYFSLFFGLIFAIFSIIVLIYYIHHIAAFIKVATIIKKVSHELFSTIDRILPDSLEIPEEESKKALSDLSKHAPFKKVSIVSNCSGYIQAIDYEGLVSLAIKNNFVLELQKKPGDYIFPKVELIKAWNCSKQKKATLEKCINTYFVVGSIRTDAQDVEYSVSELVEVAIRALSPSINDPRTAINCLDRLAEAIAILFQRKIPSPYFLDNENELRVIAQPIKISSIVDEAFNEIRQNGKNSVPVLFRLLEIFKQLKVLVIRKKDKESLNRHIEMVYQTCQKSIVETEDLEQAKQRYEACKNAERV